MLLRFIKLCLFCLLFGNLSAQSLLDTPISLDLNKKPLNEILDVISSTSGITFSFSNDQILLKKEVSVSVDNVSLKNVLDHVFNGTNIIYKKIGNQITLKRRLPSSELTVVGKKVKKLKLTQVVRGQVVDEDSSIPLIGATVWVDGGQGTSTDLDGRFVLKNVRVGRQNIRASYLGFEPHLSSEVMVISGKEFVLEINLRESPMELAEIEVEAIVDKTRPLNELAVTSARSFSVEETGRYAASILDPARMAMNFAGVSQGGSDDLNNHVSVRGNSPRSNVWRLEGVDIPNPNHYSDLGGSGGGISMLSSSTLTYSDFYTGGFPAGFGNALGGIFDINLRKGNDEKNEYSFMIGTLGVEASAEGPLFDKKGASFLINYRYSTLKILDAVGLNPVQDEDAPRFQDISFKFHLPTKNIGSFTLFGLGGQSIASESPVMNPPIWINPGDNEGEILKQIQGSIGLSHRYLLSDNSYLHSIAVVSGLDFFEKEYSLDNNLNEHYSDLSEMSNTVITLSSNYTQKINARHTFKAGLNWSHKMMDIYLEDFEVEYDPDVRRGYAAQDGVTDLIQGYAHWKFRMNKEWSLNTGLHASYFQFNKNYSIEPRAAVEYQPSAKHSVTASIGRYSKIPHETFYFFEGVHPSGDSIVPNRELDMTKSIHFILGYNYRFSKNFRLKAEAYYQHLYNVPTTRQVVGIVSTLNAEDVFDLIGIYEYVNEGKGRNYGIDLTLEKFFSNSYYFLFTGSLFESKLTTANGVEYNTRYSTNYRFNLLAGKEFKVGKRKQDIFGINGRFVLGGGARYSPINLELSKLYNRQIRDGSQLMAYKFEPYRRFDFSMNYKMNRNNITHTFSIDVQNLTSQENIFGDYYDRSAQRIRKLRHTTMIPFINYRIDF